MRVNMNITGATYRNRSAPLSAQITRNFYPEAQENEAVKSSYVLQSFPGLKFFGGVSGTNRGMLAHSGSLYKVTGSGLYVVDVTGGHSRVATIPGTQRCVMEPFGTGFVIVTGGRVFHYDGTLTEVTDGDLESPSAAASLNNFMVYDGNGSRFVVSNPGDATTIDGLDYAAAESDADPLVRPYAFEQQVYMMGSETIEPWYPSGVGNPPFDRVQGGIMQIGLLALHSVASNQRYMYFLASDNHVYRISGSTAEKITPFPIAREIAEYAESQASQATGFCFEIAGQDFYQVNLPDRSLCFHEATGQWFDVGEPGERHWADEAVYMYRRVLMADYRNGNLYELDLDTYDRNGEALTRERITGPLWGGMLNAAGREVEVNRFELIMETGTGLLSGQGEDPKIMLQVSPDGGRTWSTELWGAVGEMGAFTYRVEWGPLGAFDSCLFRIKTSDPVFYSIHSATADVEVGI